MPTPTDLENWNALRELDPVAAGHVLSQLKKTIFVPHTGGQRDVVASQARFRVLCAGRRWGKTHLGSREMIQAALTKPDQMVWCVAQADKGVRRVYRKVLSQLPRSLLARKPPSEFSNDRVIEFKNGSRMEFYTAGTPDSLAGEGVDFVLIDEAALIAPNVWFQLIRPTLTDKKGRALLISTPRGHDWFYDMFQRGQDETKGLWESWQFPSVSSPFIDHEEVEDARDTLPKVLFAQEYLAQFIQSAASIFALEGEDDGRKWNAVRPGVVNPEGWITLGVDLGKADDFTVLDACRNEDAMPCYFNRFNDINWSSQQRIIHGVVRELEALPEVEGVTVGVDSTGLGDVVLDNLEDLGLDVIPINFGSGNQKERMVRLLAGDMEHSRAFITEAQRDEFETYAYEITTNGRYKFEAPPGKHDDKVSAKMVQHWCLIHEAPPGVQLYNPETDFTPEEPEEEEGAVEVIRPDGAREIALREGAWNS